MSISTGSICERQCDRHTVKGKAGLRLVSLVVYGMFSFLTYLCEHQARLAHYLARLKNGLQAVGSGWELVSRYDSDGLRDGVHRAIELFSSGLLHLLWSPAHTMLQSLGWEPHLGVDQAHLTQPFTKICKKAKSRIFQTFLYFKTRLNWPFTLFLKQKARSFNL